MKRDLCRGVLLGAVVLLAAVGCGQATAPQSDAMLEPASSASTSESEAHIVCGREDPCPKGYICLSGIKCAQTCKTTADCPTGTTCTAVGSNKACL